ncbi:MAG: hypothetical protein AMXMBFR7_28650 [Planctomycetota bacterium]
MSTHSEKESATPAAGCLARIYWIFAGNAVPIFAGLMIATRKYDLLPLAGVYWLGVAALLAVRWCDIRFYQGKTADDRPADLGTWVRYALAVLAASGLGFGAAWGLYVWQAPTGAG